MKDTLETQIAAQYVVVISWFTPEMKTKNILSSLLNKWFPLELATLSKKDS